MYVDLVKDIELAGKLNIFLLAAQTFIKLHGGSSVTNWSPTKVSQLPARRLSFTLLTIDLFQISALL